MPEETRGTARCSADLNHQNGWKHFALAERAANFGYWRTSFADGKMFWSPGMYRLLGVDPALQLPDQVWLMDQIVPEDAEKVHRKLEEAIVTKSPFYYRTRSKDAHAPVQLVDTHGEVEIGPDGNVVAIIGVCHDVTHKVLAETEREKTQQRYRLIAEEASDIILLQENDRNVFTSNAMERLLDRKPEEFQGGRYLEIVHPEDVEEAKKVLGRPPAGETRTATYRVRHADGHYIWFEISTRGVRDETTGTFWEISVGRDISERKAHELKVKAAQERAEAANKAKTLFLANMSHELRTPLNAIIGFADIMRQRLLDNDTGRYEEYAMLIHDSGQLLLNIISDILDMAKLDAGKLELNFEDVDLPGTIEDCVRMMRERAEQAGIELTAEGTGRKLPLVADRRAVKQVLLNLLSNALKFTPPGGHVAVHARNSGGRVKLSVRDDGIGIPASELPRLGRPFEQVCDDPRLAKGGTGLGLALVRSLVEQHGGRVLIDSTEGVGTEVLVEFPAVPVRAIA